MFATLLAHQAYCSLADFRGKLGCLLVHGSIVSRVGASTKPGAVQAELREGIVIAWMVIFVGHVLLDVAFGKFQWFAYSLPVPSLVAITLGVILFTRKESRRIGLGIFWGLAPIFVVLLILTVVMLFLFARAGVVP